MKASRERGSWAADDPADRNPSKKGEGEDQEEREKRRERDTHRLQLEGKTKTTQFGEIHCLSEVYSLLYSPKQDKRELSTLV